MVDTQSRSVEEFVNDPTTQRGPMRPERLVSVRQRQDRRLAAHRFRAADTIFVFVATVCFLHQFIDRSILQTPLADAIPILAGGWAAWMLPSAFGLYRFGRSDRRVVHFARLALAVVGGVCVAAVVGWASSAALIDLSDLLWLGAIWGGGLAVLHTMWWSLVARWRATGLLTPNIVVVGATSHAEGLIASAIDRRDMNILGVFDDRAERSPLAMLGVPVLGTTDQMLRHRIMPYVDLVVVAIDHSAAARVRQVTARLAVLPNAVTLLFDDDAASRRAAAIAQIADAPLEPLHPETDAARKAFAKRVQDIVIGGAAVVLFAPLMALIAVAIRLDSPGPVFFRQRRQGFNNEEFSVWKFRTMRHADADARAVRQVTADDDRVTRVGRILRTTSLDELPQLFNVTAGEMSLVGPRPHAVGMKTGDVESAELVAEYAHRHRIKPGMTGWAAVNGSRGPLHEPEEVGRRVALDVGYIERQSMWLDLQIMLRTIPSMLGDRAAVR